MTLVLSHDDVLLYQADAQDLPLVDECVDCVVTSPPYWGLRDYGLGDAGIGLEPTPELYVEHLVEAFREVRRVLKPWGTVWLNLGDCYAASPKGSLAGQDKSGLTSTQTQEHSPVGGVDKRRGSGLKQKDLVMVPARVALALQQPHLQCKGCGNVSHQSVWGKFPNGRLICPRCERASGHEIDTPGWWLRSDIVWSKPNPMPEPVRDRPTNSHEHVFLLAKAQRYYFDAEAIREPLAHDGATSRVASLAGRNKHTVWTIATSPYSEAHFATFPELLVEPCILAGTSERGVCPTCGRPWERVVERTTMEIDRTHTRTSGTMTKPPTSTTTGWRPTCEHEADPIPATVLDPFVGAGTTCAVAHRLGRESIGVDLNAGYLALALKYVQTGKRGRWK